MKMHECLQYCKDNNCDEVMVSKKEIEEAVDCMRRVDYTIRHTAELIEFIKEKNRAKGERGISDYSKLSGMKLVLDMLMYGV